MNMEGKWLKTFNKTLKDRELEYKKVESRAEKQPDFVYHGTSDLYQENILKSGIKGGSNLTEDRKNHQATIFLSTRADDALRCAQRTCNIFGGNPIVFKVHNKHKNLKPWTPTKEHGTIFTSFEPIHPEYLEKL